jgi:hypothetical protein
MNSTQVHCNDLHSLTNIYESVMYERRVKTRRKYLLEDIGDNVFAGVQQVNVSVTDGTDMGEVRYQATVMDNSSPDVIISSIDGEEGMELHVVQLNDAGNRLSCTVYREGDVLDNFVSSINFHDDGGTELNIVKQELV